ncbi:MAG: BppU family phage baseplate upper protein, partial [Bacillaceae bacterium]
HMKKVANLTFSISSHEPVRKNPEVIEFSTQDKNTSVLRFQLKEGKEPFNLTDITGKVSLKMKDNSRFEGNAKVVDVEKGIVEYTITPEQIKHIGKAEGELVLKKGEEILSGLFFNFTIKPSLVDKELEPIKEFYLADLEVVKKEVTARAAKINVDVAALGAEIDKRIVELENMVRRFESNVGQATVVQVENALTNASGKKYASLKARMDSLESGDIDLGTF